ncbi:MAG: glycosyltransferase, partial [Pseudomonadota bacterium]
LYLPEYLHHEPFRLIRAVAYGVTRLRLGRLLRLFWRDWCRDRTRNRVRRVGQAVVLATELPPEIQHIHVHYLHTPTSVGRYCAEMLELNYTISAHAKDIWTTPTWDMREKLDSARWTTTCTRHNFDYLSSIAPEAQIRLIYHGVSDALFPPPDTKSSAPESEEITIISVARAVRKKGLDLVLEALARLPSDLRWRFVHVGGGPELDSLVNLAATLQLTSRTTWVGAASQEEVLHFLRRAHIFCLPSRIARDGDRDGLPNVLLEALSQGVAVVATNISAIPELIVDNETGLLVEPENAKDLSIALENFIRIPELRARLALAGKAKVQAQFRMEAGVDILAPLLRSELEGMRRPL